jgi:hypothetical protein
VIRDAEQLGCFGLGCCGREVVVADTAVDVGERLFLFCISHYQQAPTLTVRTRGSLYRKLEAFEEDVVGDLAVEVETFAHRPSGGEKCVGLSQVEFHLSTVASVDGSRKLSQSEKLVCPVR